MSSMLVRHPKMTNCRPSGRQFRVRRSLTSGLGRDESCPAILRCFETQLVGGPGRTLRGQREGSRNSLTGFDQL